MTQYERMTESNVKKLISSLAIPTVISMLITALYNIADTYFVSKIDNSAGAAISVVFSLMTLIQAVGFTIGMGSGSFISIFLGNKENKKASQYASQALLMGLVIGILFLTFGLLFNEGIMKLLGSTKTARPYAVKYAKWIFIAAPFMMMSFILNNILRSEGKAKYSVIGLGLGGILNIALDPILINGLDIGIAGAGIATMISQIVGFLILISFFLFKIPQSRISPLCISKSLKSYFEAVYRGLPTLFRQGFATVSNIMLNFMAKKYGDAVVNALGITAKVYIVVRNLVVGVGQGWQPVLGYNYGAKKYQRIKEGFRFTLLIQTIISITAALIVLSFPDELIRFFKNDQDLVRVGRISIRMLAISLPFLGYSTIVNQTLQVMGYSKSASFLASLRQGIVFIPILFIMRYTLGKTGLCLTQPLSDFITALISIPFFFYIFRILKGKENDLMKEEELCI